MIDSHCHINDEAFKSDPSNYIKEAEKVGVFRFLVVGCDLNSSICAVDISNRFDSCFAAVGIHPSDCKKAGTDDLSEIKKLAKSKKTIRII